MAKEVLYSSTRGAKGQIPASLAILKGLAPDGGLYVPDHIPTLEKSLREIAQMSYQDVAYEVMKLLLTDYTEDELKYCISHAYDSKFDTEEGNIIYKNINHTWVNGKCKYCGASQAVYDRGSEAEQYAYMFIHTNNPKKFFPNMHFDVIIGNPPYHLSDGGQAASAKPLYHLFVEQAIKLNPRYLTIIIPARWYAGGKGLDSFRNDMLKNNNIRKLVDYNNSSDCFPGVNIAGGVCYFMWDKENSGKCEITNVSSQHQKSKAESRFLGEFPILVRDNTAIHIIRKIISFY